MCQTMDFGLVEEGTSLRNTFDTEVHALIASLTKYTALAICSLQCLSGVSCSNLSKRKGHNLVKVFSQGLTLLTPPIPIQGKRVRGR